MHVKKRKIISLFHLGIKVGYLFITRKIVTRSDIGNSYDLVSKTYQQEYLKIMHTYNDILLNHLIKHIIIQILSKNIMIIQLILWIFQSKC